MLRQLTTERIAGWRCIGCGKVDAPQPCIGICQDRKVELVLAGDYDALLARTAELESVLALIARITPRDEEWKASWEALQQRARQVLGGRAAG
jgi:hypothetical protein